MGRLWLKNHNLHYSSYFFEETLFTPWYKGSLLSQTTCFAHGKVAGFKRLLLAICDRFLAQSLHELDLVGTKFALLHYKHRMGVGSGICVAITLKN